MCPATATKDVQSLSNLCELLSLPQQPDWDTFLFFVVFLVVSVSRPSIVRQFALCGLGVCDVATDLLGCYFQRMFGFNLIGLALCTTTIFSTSADQLYASFVYSQSEAAQKTSFHIAGAYHVCTM